ncbi:transglutaminase family protein, partial [Comamonas odontotermitis]|uniref:transglutaminase family protein n=1 Tax=Comamonas odontotermitis TaxID=379895 RepID=UPI00366E50F5
MFDFRAYIFLSVCFFLINPYANAQREIKDNNYLTIQRLLEQPDDKIDIARTKLEVDRMIDPSIDVETTLAQLDKMAKGIQAQLPPGASDRTKLEVLRELVYKPSSWNNHRPFEYDLQDPLGKIPKNRLLTTYLTTKKGNCISMPLLFMILGQKIGLDMTTARAPNHVFVKWRDKDGQYYNLETTSGAGFTRDTWMQQQTQATPEGIKSGIYMRAQTKKEAAAAIPEIVLDKYWDEGDLQKELALAELLEKYNPKSITVILSKHNISVAMLRTEFVQKYSRPIDIPANLQPRYHELQAKMKGYESQALALGWRP